MTRAVSLTAVKAGITRLREKGGASPESFYDLVNGYVTAARTVRRRPGTRIHTVLPPGTRGLVGFNGKLHVFSAEPVTMTDSRVVCHVLRHPHRLGLALARIHFAAPFMGNLYVAAEFDNGDVFHYYLEQPDTWEAETPYLIGDRVAPSTPNGYMYVATRLGDAHPPWQAGVSRTIGEIIEPTTPNGYGFECVATSGVNPASGQTEPNWPASDGATVVEVTDGEPVGPPDPVDDEQPPETGSGYQNPGGSLPPPPGEFIER